MHPEPGAEETTADSSVEVRASAFRRFWPIIRAVLALGILGLAVWILSSHTDELSGLPQAFETLNWWWVPIAVAAEGMSFVAFAGMQYVLLQSGGLRSPRGSLLKMTFASQAIANSLPGGNAVAAAYGFRWYRRFGADTTLATWGTVGTIVASAVALALVATLGLGFAASEGASLDLIPGIIGALLVTILIGALFVYEKPLFSALTLAIRMSQWAVGRPKGDLETHITRITHWVSSVRLGWRQIVRILLWGTANWLFDCSCFAFMFLAVGAPIPWKGLLLAYGAGQLATALPITPGGLGAVEGSITIALVAFGGDQTSTVDAVLLYRIVSFWLVLPIGWALCGQLAHEVRRGRWSRQALAAPVDAGPVRDTSTEPLPDPSEVS
ncbi:MAG: lysylphosphatidylglycerol synthase transmembrane domain-containing protein [Acidimicrobiales bacterium]